MKGIDSYPIALEKIYKMSNLLILWGLSQWILHLYIYIYVCIYVYVYVYIYSVYIYIQCVYIYTHSIVYVAISLGLSLLHPQVLTSPSRQHAMALSSSATAPLQVSGMEVACPTLDQRDVTSHKEDVPSGHLTSFNT